MRIDSYSFGKIVIGGRSYDSDVIIFPDRVDSWWRKEGHLLQLDDLSSVLDAVPKVLIIGTGSSRLMKVPDSLKESLSHKMKVYVEKTEKAVEMFNENEGAIAALHLTC